MTDIYPNRVGQLITTTGTNTLLVLGSQLPGYPRPLSDMFQNDGDSAIFTLIDGANYQVITGTWNAVAGTITRGAIHEGWRVVDGVGESYGTAHLSLSGGARLLAGDSRQALVDYLADASLTVNGLTNKGIANLNGTTKVNDSPLQMVSTSTGPSNVLESADWVAPDSGGTYRTMARLVSVVIDDTATSLDTRLDISLWNAGVFSTSVGFFNNYTAFYTPIRTDTIEARTGSTVTVDDNLIVSDKILFGTDGLIKFYDTSTGLWQNCIQWQQDYNKLVLGNSAQSEGIWLYGAQGALVAQTWSGGFRAENFQTNIITAVTGTQVTVNDDLAVTGTLSVTTSSPPASATATGTTGDIQWDANYIYVCTAPNTWKRAALSTW